MPLLANRPRARSFRGGSLATKMALLGLLAGCGAPRTDASTPPPATAASSAERAPATTSASSAAPVSTAPAEPASASTQGTAGSSTEGVRDFGAPFDESIESVPLETIVENPETYRDRTVRTSGVVARVCQRMGCWMELATTTGTTVRVPMAGHAFFLPRDVSGRPADVVGRVVLEALPEETKAHLESEGARATTSSIALHAISVRVH